MIGAAVIVLIVAAIAATALATYRIIRGPTHADRVVALDVFLAAAVALCIAASLASGRTVFLDVAIGLALVGFVATIGWARLIERAPGRGGAQRRASRNPRRGPDPPPHRPPGRRTHDLRRRPAVHRVTAAGRRRAAARLRRLGCRDPAGCTVAPARGHQGRDPRARAGLRGAMAAATDAGWVWRLLLVLVFLLATLPIASHLLARAALREGTDSAEIDAAPLLGDGIPAASSATAAAPAGGRPRSRLLQRLGIALALLLITLTGAANLGLFSGTRPERIGVHEGRLLPVDETRPNSVSSTASGAGHRVAPIAAADDPAAAFARLRAIVERHPGATIVESGPDYLYAEFRTPLMGFVDDVEFLLDPAARVVQVRSASRLGRGDFGVNRKRIESIRDQMSGNDGP